MQVNVGGLWTEWPDDTPLVVGFDDTLSANPSALGDNRGCPPGYAAQYVAGGWLGTSTVTRCRLITADMQAIAAESAPGWGAQAAINVAAASSAVVSAVTPVLTTTLVVVALVVAAGLWLSGRR